MVGPPKKLPPWRISSRYTITFRAISAIVTSGSRASRMLSLMGRIERAYPPGYVPLPGLSRGLMVDFMDMKTRMRISRGGQVSIPAAIRHRWGTSTVAMEDHGDWIVLQPAPDDPIAAAEGALAEEFGEIDVKRLRQIAREDERVAQARREKP